MGAIRQLDGKQFNGYLGIRIPHELDDVVTSIVDAYWHGSPDARKAMLDQMGPRSAGVLSAYGQRMATVAVRTRSEEWLRRGLVGMGMAAPLLEQLDGNQSNLIVLGAVNHAAETLGHDLGGLIDRVAPVLPETALAHFRGFAGQDPRRKRLAAMGLRTVGTGDEFRYA